jgi:hypothetical protein
MGACPLAPRWALTAGPDPGSLRAPRYGRDTETEGELIIIGKTNPITSVRFSVTAPIRARAWPGVPQSVPPVCYSNTMREGHLPAAGQRTLS